MVERVMAILGDFVFSANRVEFSSLSKSVTYRYAKVSKLSGVDELHAVGAESELKSLSGRVSVLHVGKDPLRALRRLASLKITLAMYLGNGDYMGLFQVEGVRENGDNIFDNGVPLEIGFSVELIRVDGEVFDESI